MSGKILCFKYRRRVARDNTVRYRWRTLQLLPGTNSPTYAGAAVDVLEGLHDSLSVQHEGRVVPSQEAPPRPSVLRGFAGRTTHSPITHQPTNGLGTKWTARRRVVQKAKRKGLSMRGIARELGIHRDTVKKYINAVSPPMARGRSTSTTA